MSSQHNSQREVNSAWQVLSQNKTVELNMTSTSKRNIKWYCIAFIAYVHSIYFEATRVFHNTTKAGVFAGELGQLAVEKHARYWYPTQLQNQNEDLENCEFGNHFV